MREYLLGAATATFGMISPALYKYFDNWLLTKRLEKKEQKEKLENLIALCTIIPDYVHDKMCKKVFNADINQIDNPLIQLEKICLTIPNFREMARKIAYLANKIYLNADEKKLKILNSTDSKQKQIIYQEHNKVYGEFYQELIKSMVEFRNFIYNVQDKRSKTYLLSSSLLQKLKTVCKISNQSTFSKT